MKNDKMKYGDVDKWVEHFKGVGDNNLKNFVEGIKLACEGDVVAIHDFEGLMVILEIAKVELKKR